MSALLTADEVASELRVSEWLVYEKLRRGDLKGVRVGRCVRVTRQALDDFIARGGDPPNDAAPAPLGSARA